MNLLESTNVTDTRNNSLSILHQTNISEFSTCRFQTVTIDKCEKSFVKYSCNYCGKIFYHKGSFRAHLRTHTGEKPFVCSICNRSFTQKVHLVRHIATHMK